MRAQGKTSNLPKWAQVELQRRQREIESLKKQVKVQAGEGPTAIAVNEGFLDKDADFWAPDDARVKFWLPDPTADAKAERQPPKRYRFLEIRIDVDGRLNINASRCLVARMVAGNVMTLDVEDW